MEFKDLLIKKGIPAKNVLVLRHRPVEPELNKVIKWLAAEKHDIFNAFQQTQNERRQNAMAKMSGFGYIASFIGHEPGKALFVGLYSIGETKKLTPSECYEIPAYKEMKRFAKKEITDDPPRDYILWFELSLTDFYSSWKGKLIIDWQPPERAWWRYADRNEMDILAILEESALGTAMPEWREIDLSWGDLGILPSRWRNALSQWRGVFYIFDSSDGKGYVGSAYGAENIYGRWLDYARSGHGGNKLLKHRNPQNFRFSILQRVSPDMIADDIIQLETTWKARLHTRAPFGLNEN